MKRVYLDWAAAAPVSKQAKKAFLKAIPDYGNPSGFHTEGRKARAHLERARETIARLAGAKPEHITFTSGATEANALAILGTVRAKIQDGHSPSSLHLLYHEGAHASTKNAMEALTKEGVTVGLLPHKNGEIDFDALPTILSEKTTLVSLEAVSPETGRRFDTRKVRAALHAARPSGENILFHVDGSQLPLTESISRERLGADLLTLDAQKIGGVRGVGALIHSTHAHLAPIVFGGGQEQGLRSGTEPVALIAAFAAALLECEKNRISFTERASSMRERLTKKLSASLPHMTLLGGENAAPHILTLALLKRDTDFLVALLGEAGFAVATKSACEAGSDTPSRMAYAETGDRSAAEATLRISWGPTTSEHDLMRFSEALVKAVRFLDRPAPR